MLRDKNWEFFRMNQKSAIYDSCPGWPHSPLKLLIGLENLMQNQVPLSPVRYLIASGLVGVAGLYHMGQFGKHYYSNGFEAVSGDKRLVPSLFMYSTQDKLISAESVSRFVEEKRSHGAYVDAKIYDDSEHCMIYLKHADDYSNRVKKHLVTCECDLESVLRSNDDYQSLLLSNADGVVQNNQELKSKL